MSTTSVDAFLDRLESDSEFADRLAESQQDPSAVRALLAAEGFDIEPDQVREAFVERFGAELDEEQLALIAGGMGAGAIAAIAVVGVGGSIVAAAVAAAA